MKMNQHNHIGIALDELYRVFSILNKEFFSSSLTPPMITVQKTKAKGNLGWFTLDTVWEHKETEDKKYEINMCPEYLSRDISEIICTLHHEMVHYKNRVDGVKDCNGQVHNKKFKSLAESVGLIVERSKKYGFGHTTCSENFLKFIEEKVNPKAENFAYFRNIAPKERSSQKEKTSFTYFCPKCGETVKAKKDKNIICGDCEVPFELAP